MWIKNYTASSVREALARIKDEMGPTAVILDTRVERGLTDRSGGPGSEVTVTAASGQPRVPGSYAEESTEGPKTLHLKGGPGERFQIPETADCPDAAEPETAVGPSNKPGGTPTAHNDDELVARLEMVEQSLVGISGMINSMVSASQFARWIDAPEVRPWLNRNATLKAELAEAYSGYLLDAMPDPEPFLSRDRLPAVVNFVGPAGSGKSTLLMKALAVWWRTRKSSLPVLEIIGPDAANGGPLSSWAELFNLTHKKLTVTDTGEIHKYLSEVDAESAFIRCDLPTGGDTRQLKKLNKTIRARIVVLVLSSLVRREVNERFIKRYAGFNPTHLAFTGFDEVAAFDDARHLSAISGLPLAYYTTGVAPCDEIEPFTNNLLRGRIAAEIGMSGCVGKQADRDEENAKP